MELQKYMRGGLDVSEAEVDSLWTPYAVAQRALDAEREKVKRLSTCGTDHSTPWWQVKCEDLEAQLATLTQQLAHANEQLRLYRASADDACGLRQQVAQLTAELDAHIETSKKLFSQMVGMKTELNDAQVDLTRWQAQYHALIMAVGKKYPGETRHQTALRYIKQAEDKSELRSALELCVARLEGLKEDGITQAEQQALDAANTALDARAGEGG